MAYDNSIPKPTDRLKNSQNDLLNNFIAIKTLVDVNHVTFDATGQGKHKWVTLPEQLAAPANSADEGYLYTKQGPISAVTELFFERENGTEVGFTEHSAASVGWSYLPSGMLVKWGTGSGTGDFAYTNSSAPYFTTIYNVLVSTKAEGGAGGNNRIVHLKTFSVAAGVSFTLNLSSAKISSIKDTGSTGTLSTYYWLAIGV